ncbi:MAG: hypothetical protein GXP41_02360 [Chloroflexi bacterium]|nr:hypothetical protein [Chloroflexota bacterium]
MVIRTGVVALVLFMISGLLVACGGAQGTPSPASGQATATVPSAANAASPTSAPAASPIVTATVVTATAPAGVVAMVNGQPISEDAFDQQMAQVRAFLKQQGTDLESDEGKQILDQDRHRALEQMVDQELVRQAAIKLGIEVTDAQLEKTVQKGIEQGGGREKLDAWLEQNQLTYENYKELIRNDLIANAVRQKVVGDVPQTARQVHARHILVNSKEEALDILAQLKAGGDFAALAKEKSLDVVSREKGGDLGFFPAGIMTPAFEKAAFALKPNEISGVVQTPFGFHIIQVLEVDPARELSQDMQQRIEDQRFRRWLAQQRSQATIERYLP